MFVTLFMARSGSKYLRSLLNQHPDIHDFGEIFHERQKNFGSEVDVFKKISEILLSGHKQIGVQFRYPRHVHEFPEVYELLKSSKQVKILLLKRRNKLKGAVSQQNAEALKKVTGKAHLFKGSTEKVDKLRLDIPRAIKESLQRESLDEEYGNLFSAKHQCLDVFYEDLCDEPAKTLDGILDFLQLSRFKEGSIKDSELVKVTSDDLSAAIENYDELTKELGVAGRLDWLELPENRLRVELGAEPELFDVVDVLERSADKGVVLSVEKNILGNKRVEIYLEVLPIRTNTMFLERTDRELISAQGDRVMVSRDGGVRWNDVLAGKEFKKCFTTLDGTHLLQGDTGTIYRYSGSWRSLSFIETGSYPWHGSWSIDQNAATKTIIWCEYPYCAETVNVWRSTDDGKSWRVCFSQIGHSSDPKSGSLRHFHLVQKCSSVESRWYLSSGDTERQSRFWVSNDDGESWQEVLLGSVGGNYKDIPSTMLGKLYRFTSMIQTDDKLVWVTDDTFNGVGAKFCIVRKDRLGDINVVKGDCGKNEIRNLIQIDDRYGLAVSEAKLDIDFVYLTLIDFLDESVVWSGKLKNERKVKANFMNGVSSRFSVGGEFFFRSDNKVIYPSSMTMKGKVHIRDR